MDAQSKDDLVELPADFAVESEGSDSRYRWFLRGGMAGVLLMASANALSYFIRSPNWHVIALSSPAAGKHTESLGFPFKMWEEGNTYGGFYIDYPMLGANVLFALVISSLIGFLIAWKTDTFNHIVSSLRFESGAEPRDPQPVQFSLRSLMITTAVVAVIATLAKNFAANRETLVGIYLVGPACLVAIAMGPRKLSWQTRVKIIVPLTLGLIAAAIAVGVAIGLEFDEVLLGIFLCWTPQSAMAAIALTTWLIYRLWTEIPNHRPTIDDARAT